MQGWSEREEVTMKGQRELTLLRTYRATHGCCCSNSKMDSVFSQTQVTKNVKANRIRTPKHSKNICMSRTGLFLWECLPSEGALSVHLSEIYAQHEHSS